jgi:hypothetical protein
VKDAFTALSGETDTQLDKLKKVTADEVKDFNKMVLDRRVQVIMVK